MEPHPAPALSVAAPVVPSGRSARPDRRRRLAALAVLAALTVPTSAGAVTACTPGPGRVLEHRALLATDGEARSVSSRLVGAGGIACAAAEGPTAGDLGVVVAIAHRDADGATLEAGELARHDGTVVTRVRVVDATASDVVLTAVGPDGQVRAERRVGAPLTVRIDVAYPASWSPVASDGAVVREDGRATVVSTTTLLAVPFTPDEAVIEVAAEPGRGVPEVTVEVTTLPGPVLAALRDRGEDRETFAVLGALLEVTTDGTVELADGARELADGLDQLADGTEELADGTAELADGVDALVEGVALLADGSGQLSTGTSDYAAGTAQYVVSVDEVIAGFALGTGGIAEGLAALGPAFPDGSPLKAFYDQLLLQSQGLADGAAALADPDGAFVAGGQGLTAGGEALADGTEGLADGTDELLAGVQELAEGTRALAEGTRELADGAREAADGARQLADGAAELPEGLAELLGVADRRAAALALDEAEVARAAELADARTRGADGVVSVLTTAEDPGAPTALAGAAAGALLVPAAALVWWRRRRSRA